MDELLDGAWGALGVALLVLLMVLVIRLWPRRPTTFQSSEPFPSDREEPPQAGSKKPRDESLKSG